MNRLSPLADVLDLQDGVVARRQVLVLEGESDATIRRRLRRREWVALLPGVYLNHTGEPTWRQRAWAAVLYAAPAALAGVSALRAAEGPGRRSHDDTGPIHVAVPGDRRVRDQPGVLVERCETWSAITQQNTSPPRVRIEHAALDAASCAATDLVAIGILSDVVRSRRSTAERLLGAARARARLARRHLIVGVLVDAAAGAASVLEVEFLRRVERAHGLPRAQRQIRDVTSGVGGASSVIYRDVQLIDRRLVIELDGRLGHTSISDRDGDLERDLDAALLDHSTVRLGWGQVHARPCVTAVKLAILFRKRGWTGAFRRCPDCPADLQIPDSAA